MTLKEKKVHVKEIIRRLKIEYPSTACTLDYTYPWQLLISVRLAAQCTDSRVNVITKELFEKYKTIDDFISSSPEKIEKIVRPAGLSSAKSKDIYNCMVMLKEKFNYKVPDNLNDLLLLPGVGRKSANLIMGDVYNKPAIVTDTHCIRISNRLGLVDNETNPVKVEMALLKVVPKRESNDFCHRLVDHGRIVCVGRTKPHCDKCCLKDICPSAEF